MKQINRPGPRDDAFADPSSEASPSLWRCVALVGAANVANWALSGGYNGDPAFYNALRRPAWAPPDWVFAPVWVFNNATNIWADMRLAASGPRDARWRAAAALQGVFWGAFFAFGPAYFRKRSPVLGFAVTALGAAATAASAALAARIDRRIARGLLPTLAWTTFATAVSGWVAYKNPDPVVGWRGRP